jgi:hypothetical protein
MALRTGRRSEAGSNGNDFKLDSIDMITPDH